MADNFEEVVKEIAPHIEKEQKVIDITSVKEEPVRIMHKYLKNARRAWNPPDVWAQCKGSGPELHTYANKFEGAQVCKGVWKTS
jgi:hypothetical protein